MSINWNAVEHVVALAGGASLLLHEGIPRCVGFVMGFVLRHPKGRRALEAWEPQILQGIQDAKDEAQKDIEAAKVQDAAAQPCPTCAHPVPPVKP